MLFINLDFFLLAFFGFVVASSSSLVPGEDGSCPVVLDEEGSCDSGLDTGSSGSVDGAACASGIDDSDGICLSGSDEELRFDPSKERTFRKLDQFKPNILMVVMDDLGSKDLGIHGSGIQTPCKYTL